MITPRELSGVLAATLGGLIIGARDWIRFETRHWLAWWKIGLAILVGAFITAVMVWAAGLEYLVFDLFDIKIL